ncbi:MAG: ImmA/IrrE family metallo-endopeptidase [Leptolyngbya sp. PLA2]|nr:ImmA/IrrE family metallo-endopeptidase [Leptolyngbya sp. PL-A2]MCQ3941427.1 DNA-binding protein [cyanobacterium CYA1]MDL1904540.1 ImmA/IrrE family metallo-endopeptidase [Synechococcales cyanobacterium CNB]
MTRVQVRPELIQWACDRAGYGAAALSKRFPKLEAWQRGEAEPTLKQLETFALATHTPFGYFFLAEPPVEQVPIPDFRTIGNELIEQPTPNLLDTIYVCQQRQEWYREYCRMTGEQPLPFIGSVSRTDDVVATAERIRSALGFSIEERRQIGTWTEALRRFIEQADALGILVMVNGVVGSNNRRKLDPAEFRGFALSDPLAPLVFINGADTKAAQMFTLAHELVHLWLAETGLSDVGPVTTPSHDVEIWCNRVAAELLVPLTALRREYQPHANLQEEVPRLARAFKVSTLVILRRIHDAGGLTREQLWAEYEAELSRLRQIARSSGGDFYLTTAARVGKRFARAVVSAALEGRSSFTEAFRLLGFKKMSTFHELGVSLGVDA